MRAAGWAPCACCTSPSPSTCFSSGQPLTPGATQVGTGWISPTPSSRGPSSSGRRGPPEVRSTIPGTPSCTRRERPHWCSGARAPGWWSTDGASSPPRSPSPWLTPSSALRTSSPSSTPCTSMPRACSWKPMPSSAPWGAEPDQLGFPASLPPRSSSSSPGRRSQNLGTRMLARAGLPCAPRGTVHGESQPRAASAEVSREVPSVPAGLAGCRGCGQHRVRRPAGSSRPGSHPCGHGLAAHSVPTAPEGSAPGPPGSKWMLGLCTGGPSWAGPWPQCVISPGDTGAGRGSLSHTPCCCPPKGDSHPLSP